MSNELLHANISYLVAKNVSVKKTNEENEENEENALMRQTVSNTLADMNHKLSDEDIIFVYSLSDERVRVEPDNPDNRLKRIETFHIGIYTKNNIFIEVKYNYSQNMAYVAGISKHSIVQVQPDYRNVGDPDKVVNNFEELDHLTFELSDYYAPITLYSHEYSANKTIKEIYLDFIKRLK